MMQLSLASMVQAYSHLSAAYKLRILWREPVTLATQSLLILCFWQNIITYLFITIMFVS